MISRYGEDCSKIYKKAVDRGGVACVEQIGYNDQMRKILVISLYDGTNEIEMVEAEEIEEFTSNMEKCEKGDKVVWLGEEFMYVEL